MANETTNPKLFTRDGIEFTGHITRDENGKPFHVYISKCSRCGGLGGSDKWAYTGWTCFECGGNGNGREKWDALYTADKLAKLNAAQGKRNAKKAAEQAAKAAELQARRDANRTEFVAAHQWFFDIAAALNDDFVNNMVSECKQRVALSENQIVLIIRKAVQAAVKAEKQATAAWVGEIGERREFTCTVTRFFDWTSRFTKYCFIMRDENGQTIKYIGSSFLGGVKWEGDYSDKYPVVQPEEVIRFKATIEAHEDYKGEKQTIVARPKLMDAK